MERGSWSRAAPTLLEEHRKEVLGREGSGLNGGVFA